jgi:hypothetical protein
VEDSSSSFPTVEEVRAIHQPGRSNKAKRALLLFLLIVVLALALGLGLGIGLPNRNEEEEEQVDYKGAFADAPDGPSATFEEIVDWLASEGISSDQVLEEEGSPQNRAARWLADTDLADLPLPETSANDSLYSYMYMVRYVMALIYYQMNGENWLYSVDFLSAKPVCEWHTPSAGLTGGYTGGRLGTEEGGVLCDDELGIPIAIDLGKLSVCWCTERCIRKKLTRVAFLLISF